MAARTAQAHHYPLCMYIQSNHDGAKWDPVNWPHYWAIKGSFYARRNVPFGGSMGRLPVHVFFANGDKAELWVNGKSQGSPRRESKSADNENAFAVPGAGGDVIVANG
ncbi:hypothetical protein VTH06DRAFT_4051 [Thermothelomyces fergusii]